MNEIKIVLDEFRFTNFCKLGFIQYKNKNSNIEIPLTKLDIKTLFKEDTLEKKYYEDKIVVMLLNIDKHLLKEIIKRSPLFSDLYYEL